MTDVLTKEECALLELCNDALAYPNLWFHHDAGPKLAKALKDRLTQAAPVQPIVVNTAQELASVLGAEHPTPLPAEIAEIEKRHARIDSVSEPDKQPVLFLITTAAEAHHDRAMLLAFIKSRRAVSLDRASIGAIFQKYGQCPTLNAHLISDIINLKA